jgi:hypothetical protein
MSEYDGARRKARSMVDGYGAAVDRFSAAIRSGESDPSATALFEALNWVHALDDLIGEIWRPDKKKLGRDWHKLIDGAEILGGVRYARNRVHHQWADALRWDQGFRFPMRFPLVMHSWVWAPADELPTADRPDPDGRAIYERMLANVRAEDALFLIRDVFAQVMDMLEPRIAPSRAPNRS